VREQDVSSREATAMSDPLSEILRLVRLTSSVYFLHDMKAPWSMRIDKGPHAVFHLVAAGRCKVITGAGTIEAETGDVVVFPRGDDHELASEPGAPRSRPGLEVVQAIHGGQEPFDGDGPATRLLCGHFSYDADLGSTVFDGLPDCVHVRAFDRMAFAWRQRRAPARA
jgi:AraC family transcriptional regulator, activator of mtrCDE